MIRRIAKLMFYIKAPFKAFVVFHPVKAAKLWLAYVLGSALFGARKRAERDGAGASGWGEGRKPGNRIAPAREADPPLPAGAAPGRANGGDSGERAQDEAPADAVSAVSVPEGNQAS